MLSLLLPAAGPGCAGRADEAPLAERGQLDLSGWDPARDGPAALDGQWAFYWDRLLSPADFESAAAPPEPSGFLRIPGFWNGFEHHGEKLPAMGMATLRLRILPGPGQRRWEIGLFSIPAAFRLWANGRLIARAGQPGATARQEIPERLTTLAALESDGKPIELTLEISNHAFRRGGVHYPILLAAPGQLEAMHLKVWAWSMFFVGGLMLIAVYHFILFFIRKKDISTLYVGLYCLLLILMHANMDSSDWLANLVFPNADSMVLNTIGVTCYVISNSILYRFYRSIFRDVFIPAVQHFCDIKSVAFLIIVLFCPYSTIFAVLPYFALLSLCVVTYVIIKLSVCVRRGYDSAGILLFGCVILAATAVYEIYAHLFSTKMDTAFPMALLAFSLSLAFALARRFSNAFTTVETLSRTMDAQNIALRTEMEERNRLEREIVSVSEEERRRISHDLHDGLCQRLGGIRLRCGVLELTPLENREVAEKIAEISALLEESLGQAYDLSRGLWPLEREGLGAGAPLLELARRVGEASGVAIDYEEELACPACDNPHLVQLFRIAQEAVANAVKHAKAGRIVIRLCCRDKGRLHLSVRDDGAGRAAASSPGKGGLGLHIMRYRARVVGGEFSIRDARPRGTEVSCSLACERSEKPV